MQSPRTGEDRSPVGARWWRATGRLRGGEPDLEDRMSNLIAVAYPDETTAREVGQTLMELQKEHSIELEDLAIAVRQPDGKIKLRQTFKTVASGAAGGA